MITIFTGAPGAGKTAAMVDLLYSELKDRPLYVDGLEGLTIPHFPCDANKWHEDLPDGAVLVVDEAQRKWRPRGSAAKVPPDVAAMETHRHRGIDIFMTTQRPNLIDSNVRGLCGRHVHIRDVGVLGRQWYEWPECNDGVNWKGCTNKRRYVLPKRVFDLYKSASLHVKPIRSVPRVLFVVIMSIILFVAGLWYVKNSIQGKVSPHKPSPSAAAANAPSVPASAPDPVQGSGGQNFRDKVVIDDRVDWIPRVSDRPESAPAYDSIRTVAAMPTVQGGVCMRGVCKCYTAQGTNAGLSHKDCEPIVKHGRFDPYTKQVVHQVSAPPPPRPNVPPVPVPAASPVPLPMKS